MYRSILAAILVSLSTLCLGQINIDKQLAEGFFQKQEYDKAIVLYEKLFARNPSTNIYKKYMQTLLALEDYPMAQKVAKKHIKRHPGNLTLLVDLGYVYKKAGSESKANSTYTKAINSLKMEKALVNQLATAFTQIRLYERAIETYEYGQKLFGRFDMFNYELASVYERMGDFESLIKTYLDLLESDPTQLQMVKNGLQRSIVKSSSHKLLQSKLYRKIQKSPNNTVWPELLIWQLIQIKDFKGAFVQVKALDKRFNESGRRVFNLARTAYGEKDYEAAIECYEYIIEKNAMGSYNLMARIEILRCRKELLVQRGTFTEPEVLALKSAYENLLATYGRNSTTSEVIFELAKLEAFYLHNLDEAISQLEEMKGLRGLPRKTIGEAKLYLGDYYLMQGQHWEASLLYSQVDKAFKDDIFGEEARFRNARLSYYKGEFEWAQAQLKVLQAATSELIANDALDLYVFIQDHLGLDTILTPMVMYGEADLLAFQNKPDEAFQLFEDLKNRWPGHSLTDNILFAQTKIRTSQNKFEQALELLQELDIYYGNDVLADDAIFLMAELYEYSLGNPEKAMEQYERIIMNFAGSTYVVEARKRFRKLRGDKLN